MAFFNKKWSRVFLLVLGGLFFSVGFVLPLSVSAQEAALPSEDGAQEAVPTEESLGLGNDSAEDVQGENTEEDTAQDGGEEALPTTNALPPGPNQAFSFDNEEFEFEKSNEQIETETRKEAFDAALQALMPLKPEEIRTLIERNDRIEESIVLPVRPSPKPEMVVEDISLDPGAEPKVLKMAQGHVTTVTFTDVTGAPWPVQEVIWSGNFNVSQVQKTKNDKDAEYTHMFWITAQGEYAQGNMSIRLTGLQTPIILLLETNREVVHYRFDAVIGEYGPLAQAPIISPGLTSKAGNKDLSSVLEGVPPEGAVRLNVSGVDGRTSAYRMNNQIYVRTPMTLLSPGWSGSVSSADGTHVYEINDAPVLLLSERGQMVRAKLSDREDLLDE